MTASRVTLLGAVDEVTGSGTLIDTGDRRILVDLGLVQGSPEAAQRNTTLPDIDLRWLDAVALTHVHVDHCGRLPMLMRKGWTGSVYCSEPTADLLPMVLKGSARLQRIKHQEWSDHRNRGIAVKGDAPPPVLYTAGEVDALLDRVVPVPMQTSVDLGAGVRLRLQRAGHILGAASVQILTPDTSMVCSGDLGRCGMPPTPDPTPCPKADLVVLESTYGNRARHAVDDVPGALAHLLAKVRLRGGPLVIPTFAIGRTQQLLHVLGTLSRAGTLDMNVYLDSAMAARATQAHAHWPSELHADCATDLHDPLHFESLFMLMSRRESKRLQDIAGPAVIMAGNGFGEGGPILRHLARWLPDPTATILLTGHCLDGTLVGHLASDPPFAFIDGIKVPVQAHIELLDAFGGHADAAGLTTWLLPGAQDATVLLNHGEADARAALAQRLQGMGVTVRRPNLGEAVDVIHS